MEIGECKSENEDLGIGRQGDRKTGCHREIIFLRITLTNILNKHKQMRIILNYIILLLTTSAIASDSGCQISLLKSDEQSFIIEVNIEQFTISQDKNKIAIDGVGYNNEFGKPRLPIKVVLLDIPAYSKFNVTVLEQKSELIEGVYIAPSPTPVIRDKHGDEIDQIVYEVEEDINIYQTDKFYPDKQIELNYLGFIRDHHLMQVKINVVQYNPVTGIVRLNNRIKFELKKTGVEQQSLQGFETVSYRDERSDVFDKILENQVLNFPAKRIDAQAQSIKIKQDTEGKFKAIDFYRQISDLEKYKITVNKDGIYKLSYAYLNEAGLNLATINPQKISFYNRGQEVPVYIHGEEDDRFDSIDYILFYGEANKTIFSNDNIYWLVIDEYDGLRMGIIDGTFKNETNILNLYKAKLKLEKNLIYKAYMPNRGDKDHWTWEEIKYGEKKDFKFFLSEIDTSTSNKALISFMFYSAYYAKHNHVIELSINGNEAGAANWHKDGNHLITMNFPQSYLIEGENILSIKSLSIEDYDIIILDWFEIEYWRSFYACDGVLEFDSHKTGNYSFEIKGFRGDSIKIFEIENIQAVNSILNPLVIRDSLDYILRFQADIDTNKKYICIEKDKMLIPKGIEIDEFSDLCLTNQQSDYLIITHELFYDSIIPLAEIHREEGLTVDVVKINDIYDEFNYGIFNPRAIKDFLKYTYYHWMSPPPTFVLLVGDASYDYKDYLEIGNRNYVPTHLYKPMSYGESASDNWFVSISGDDILPDMLCGRLAVQTASEVDAIVEKIIEYKNDYTHCEWKKNISFIADDSEGSEKFEILSDNLIKLIPTEYNVKKSYLRDFKNSAEIKEKIIKDINNGCLIVNYIGHGGIDLFAHERIFKIENILRLVNRKKFPFVTAFTCSSGMFQHAERECLAEELVKAENKGAIGVFTATGSIYVYPDNALGKELFNSIFVNENYTIGSCILQAKLNYLNFKIFYEDVIELYTLFGDPAINLNVINPLAPVVELQYEETSLVYENQYVSKNPLFMANINYSQPLTAEHIEISLDDKIFGIENPFVNYFPYEHNSADIEIQTDFESGTHNLRVLVQDTTGLKGEDRFSFTIEKEELCILKLLNYPNPFTKITYFTYELSQPANVTIKIYTVAGRLIKVLNDYSISPFNTMEWDSCDSDGDRIANGVYFYKLIAKKGNKSVAAIEKLAKIE